MKEGVSYIYDSFQGFGRSRNKDGVAIHNCGEYILAALFDGVSGDEKSHEGVEAMARHVRGSHGDYRLAGGGYGLRELVRDLQSRVMQLSQAEVRSTGVFLYLPKQGSPLVSHLGDSRLYGLEPRGARRYTKDDNIAAMPNFLTKCLGLASLGEEDFYERVLPRRHKRWLLCSDGFYGVAEGLEEMGEPFFEALALEALPEAAELVRQKIEGSNRDDATYVLIEDPEESSGL